MRNFTVDTLAKKFDALGWIWNLRSRIREPGYSCRATPLTHPNCVVVRNASTPREAMNLALQKAERIEG